MLQKLEATDYKTTTTFSWYYFPSCTSWKIPTITFEWRKIEEKEMQLLAVATIACTDICLKKRQNKREDTWECGHSPGWENGLDKLFFYFFLMLHINLHDFSIIYATSCLVLRVCPSVVSKGDVIFLTWQEDLQEYQTLLILLYAKTRNS